MTHNVEVRLSVQIAACSDVGCIREENQDSFGYDSALGIFVLCDGMGGEAAGQVASQLGVASFMSFVRDGFQSDNTPEDLPADGLSEGGRALARAIQFANKAIYEAAAIDVSRRGMGTTIVAGLLRGTTLTIGHVGDSRIYLLRNGAIEQLTNDHSLVMEQVRRGLMTLQEAAQSPMQNVITRALGIAETVEPDIADHDLGPGDIVLFCSDGLTRHVSDEEILSLVSKSKSLQDHCDALIEAAKSAGGSDNITCLLLRFTPPA